MAEGSLMASGCWNADTTKLSSRYTYVRMPSTIFVLVLLVAAACVDAGAYQGNSGGFASAGAYASASSSASTYSLGTAGSIDDKNRAELHDHGVESQRDEDHAHKGIRSYGSVGSGSYNDASGRKSPGADVTHGAGNYGVPGSLAGHGGIHGDQSGHGHRKNDCSKCAHGGDWKDEDQYYEEEEEEEEEPEEEYDDCDDGQYRPEHHGKPYKGHSHGKVSPPSGLPGVQKIIGDSGSIGGSSQPGSSTPWNVGTGNNNPPNSGSPSWNKGTGGAPGIGYGLPTQQPADWYKPGQKPAGPHGTIPGQTAPGWNNGPGFPQGNTFGGNNQQNPGGNQRPGYDQAKDFGSGPMTPAWSSHGSGSLGTRPGYDQGKDFGSGHTTPTWSSHGSGSLGTRPGYDQAKDFGSGHTTPAWSSHGSGSVGTSVSTSTWNKGPGPYGSTGTSIQSTSTWNKGPTTYGGSSGTTSNTGVGSGIYTDSSAGTTFHSGPSWTNIPGPYVPGSQSTTKGWSQTQTTKSPAWNQGTTRVSWSTSTHGGYSPSTVRPIQSWNQKTPSTLSPHGGYPTSTTRPTESWNQVTQSTRLPNFGSATTPAPHWNHGPGVSQGNQFGTSNKPGSPWNSNPITTDVGTGCTGAIVKGSHQNCNNAGGSGTQVIKVTNTGVPEGSGYEHSNYPGGYSGPDEYRPGTGSSGYQPGNIGKPVAPGSYPGSGAHGSTSTSYQPGINNYGGTTKPAPYYPGLANQGTTKTPTYNPEGNNYGGTTKPAPYYPGVANQGKTKTPTYNPEGNNYGGTTKPAPYYPGLANQGTTKTPTYNPEGNNYGGTTKPAPYYPGLANQGTTKTPTYNPERNNYGGSTPKPFGGPATSVTSGTYPGVGCTSSSGCGNGVYGSTPAPGTYPSTGISGTSVFGKPPTSGIYPGNSGIPTTGTFSGVKGGGHAGTQGGTRPTYNSESPGYVSPGGNGPQYGSPGNPTAAGSPCKFDHTGSGSYSPCSGGGGIGLNKTSFPVGLGGYVPPSSSGSDSKNVYNRPVPPNQPHDDGSYDGNPSTQPCRVGAVPSGCNPSEVKKTTGPTGGYDLQSGQNPFLSGAGGTGTANNWGLGVIPLGGGNSDANIGKGNPFFGGGKGHEVPQRPGQGPYAGNSKPYGDDVDLEVTPLDDTDVEKPIGQNNPFLGSGAAGSNVQLSHYAPHGGSTAFPQSGQSRPTGAGNPFLQGSLNAGSGSVKTPYGSSTGQIGVGNQHDKTPGVIPLGGANPSGNFGYPSQNKPGSGPFGAYSGSQAGSFANSGSFSSAHASSANFASASASAAASSRAYGGSFPAGGKDFDQSSGGNWPQENERTGKKAQSGAWASSSASAYASSSSGW